MSRAVVALILATVLCGCDKQTRDVRLRGDGKAVASQVPVDPWTASMDAAAGRLTERLQRWSSADQAACRRQCVCESPEAAMRAFERALAGGRLATAESVARAWREAFGETALDDAVAAYRRDPRATKDVLSLIDVARLFVRAREAQEAAAVLDRVPSDVPATLWGDEAALLRAKVRCLTEQEAGEVEQASSPPTRLAGTCREALRLIRAYRAAKTDGRRGELLEELVTEARAVNGLQLAAELESLLPVGSGVSGGRGAATWCGYLARGCLSAGMPELALRYAGQWQAQADSLGDAVMQNEVCRVLSAAHAAMGRNDIALHHAMAAVDHAGDLSPQDQAAAASQLGCVLAAMGRHEQAAAIFLHGLDWGGEELPAAQRADLALNAATELIRSGSLDKAQEMIEQARIEPNDRGAAPRTLRREALNLVLRCVRGDADGTANEAGRLLTVAEAQGDWRFVEQYGGLSDRAARASRTAMQHALTEKPEDYGVAKPREVLKEMFNEGGQ
ncbi:MAG: hypothetical protein JXL80_05085 [Planctomycetes bacterium]|nr:hypothetical protein [Planctomycetota bacterium]